MTSSPSNAHPTPAGPSSGKPSKILKVGHTADWHLRPSQFSRKQRGEHFFKGALSALKSAYENGIQVVLNSGDILDKNRQRTCNIRELYLIDKFLLEHGMTMYTITGNHDLDSPTWLETLFDRTCGPGLVPIDGKTVQIPGTDLTVGGMTGHNAETWLAQLKATKVDNLPDIVLWHGGVDGFMGFSAYDVTATQIMEAAPTVKFFALGDLHISRYETNGRQVIGYPGSTEMCSISEEETKYLVAVNVSKDSAEVTSRISLDTTPVFRINCTSKAAVEDLAFTARCIAANEFSLVHLVYSAEFVDDARNFARQLDETKVIIRRKRLSSVTKTDANGLTQIVNVLKSPDELLHKFLDKRDPWFPVAQKLANKHFDPKVVVEHLIQEYAPEKFRTI